MDGVVLKSVYHDQSDSFSGSFFFPAAIHCQLEQGHPPQGQGSGYQTGTEQPLEKRLRCRLLLSLLRPRHADGVRLLLTRLQGGQRIGW